MKHVQIIKNQFACAGLQAWAYVRRKPLKLHVISEPGCLVFSGSSLDLSWQVSGCYKIVINQCFILPGYVSRVQLDAEQIPDVVEIRFFGYGRQLTKNFVIRKINLRLKQSPLITVSPCRPKLSPEHQWPELFTTIQPVRPSFPTLLYSRQHHLPLPRVPFFNVPVLNMRLQPYPLQPTQPDYETTVL